MRRISRTVALTAVALALAGLAGCKKDEDKKADEPAAGDPKPADVSATSPGAATPATPAPGAAQPTPGATAAPAPGQPMPSADPGQRPATVTDEHLKIADNIVESIGKFADALDAAKADCKKATQVVKTEGKKVKSAMGDTEKLQSQLHSDPAAMQWFQKTYGPKMMGAIGKLGGVVNACRQDKEFEAAFKGLEIGGRPHAEPANKPPTPPDSPAPTPSAPPPPAPGK
ncbi:MAG TPA: hypothetical protein VK698_22795 [Kofleriaceae bacterium]|nr:hypothetical protein [Kofleriaceae bacterium]